jgi:nucleolar complex protein 3
VLQTIIDVFRSDLTGMHAQTLVRLIARMIKERKFQVHPNILSAFLQLRLRKELDGKKHRGGGKGRPGQDVAEKKFKSEVRKKWATKNQKKREKEMKEVEAEMAEAEAEVDKEERAQVVSDDLTRRDPLSYVVQGS